MSHAHGERLTTLFDNALPGGALRQGDIIRDVPLPLLPDEGAAFGNKKTHEVIPAVTRAALEKHNDIYSLFPLVRGNAMILSQCCDCEDVDRRETGRILVAQLVACDDERFVASYEKAVASVADSFARKLSAAGRAGKTVSQDDTSKAMNTLENPRKKALTEVALGQRIGAFPVAAHAESSLSMSICYFDTVVSLPANWLSLLKQSRVLHLSPTWRAVLQESLGAWITRFAYPGTLEDRLKAAGLADE